MKINGNICFLNDSHVRESCEQNQGEEVLTKILLLFVFGKVT
jgi:hypothetical protein